VWTPPIDEENPRRLTLRCDGAVQDLAYESHTWTMKSRPSPADAAGAFDIVHAVATAQAEGWVADHDDGTFGLEGTRSPCTVSLTVAADGGERTVTLTFGSPTEGGFYAKADGGPVFVAASSLRDAIRRPLVDRSVPHADAAPPKP
jgi:hypothetical protein